MTRSTAVCWGIFLVGSWFICALIRGITPEMQAAFQKGSAAYLHDQATRYLSPDSTAK